MDTLSSINKGLIEKMGFLPKENAKAVFYKDYKNANNYHVEIDFENKKFNYGNKITSGSATTQNFSQTENWVVLECIDRLLTKGYRPEDIMLEKIYPSGHGTSGRLDILVKKDNMAYLMIECKTWGKEFEKEFSKLQKNGGQLFTYFQQDKDTEYLMLYTSIIHGKNIEYKSEIIKIEDHYRSASNVVDVYIRWNKLTNQNGIFEDWVEVYDFQNKLLTKKELKPVSETNSSFIFHEFLSILRKHSVSDKPNAFNKIFNLFLAKIYDEKKRENDELDFQWKEKSDNSVDFQIRLINLHREGMLEFLKKEIEGIEDNDFKYKDMEDLQKKKKKWLKFNNVFAIKEVIDDESFDDNQRVLKEVVELLQKYQIRYPRKQQHLSDFFEKLLTTGLKQESGQFFTPPPIARYIIKSLPIKEYIRGSLNNPVPRLPAVIDYAVGSGHFITETMEEYQNTINILDTDNFYPDAIKEVETWKQNQYSWAAKYIYGVEKDYRLVKVAKVGCYFYGDGLAQIIYGDGLDSFRNSKSYTGLLKQKNTDQDNRQFSFVVSNPPYSVSSFKSDIKNEDAETAFGLYKYLTDQSSEIECLFIERTKQLLRDGGIAGIILPSSILSNTGIYTKTREIILKYFEIIGITELGSGTFMATGTNTVVLFLRKRSNHEWQNIQDSIDKFFTNFQDITVNGIENIFSKYTAFAWKDVSLDDYASLCKKTSNEIIQKQEIYQEYNKKLKVRDNEDLHKQIIEIEKGKILYFILAYKQKFVLTKTGKKKEEKQFLGYEFSNRRGYEGMHPTQKSKSIDECTSLFDPNTQENPEKANFYTYKNFLGEDFEIKESMQKNISVINLIDAMTFDRVDFEKTISLNVKKKIRSKWRIVKIEEIKKEIINGSTPSKQHDTYWDKKEIKWATVPDLNDDSIYIENISQFVGKQAVKDHLLKVVPVNSVLISCTATIGKVNINKIELTTNQQINAIICNKKIISEYLAYYLRTQKENLENLTSNSGVKHVNLTMLSNFKLPLPPRRVQEKIVKDIEVIDEQKEKNKKKAGALKNKIDSIIDKSEISKKQNLGDVLTLEYGNPLTEGDRVGGEFPVVGSNGIIGRHNQYLIEGPSIIIGRKGSAGKVNWVDKNNFPIDTTFYVNLFKDCKLKFMYFVLKKLDLGKLALGSGVPGLNRNNVYNLSFGFPSFNEQQKIISEIEGIEQEIEKLNFEIKNSEYQKKKCWKKYL